MKFDRFALDLTRGCLRSGKQQIDLRPKAFDVLRHLAENAGRLVPKQELHDAVWPQIAVGDDSLVQCIGELRQKLGDGERRLIKTVFRRGYLLDVRISASDPPSPSPEPAAADSTPPSLPLPERPSIAVLPFRNMSGDAEQEYFSDGITEDITTALSRLRWSFVIDRNSTFVYKERPVGLKQVGRELGVRYVLEGSVRKIEQRLRVSAKLMDAVAGGYIWSERYDRELTDIFALQDEITTSVTAAIEPKLLAAEGLRAETRSIDDLGAWDLVARALFHFWRLSATEVQTAIAILREAVERYPNYAPAHSMLARALVYASYLGWTPTGCDKGLAARLARRAVELDESDPWAYLALGYVAVINRETDEAVSCIKVALRLNPNFAGAHSFLGWALVLGGRPEEAMGCCEQAMRMNPHEVNAATTASMAAAHYLVGHYAEAVKAARQALRRRPRFLAGQRILCASLAQAGQLEEARSVLGVLRQMHPEISLAWFKQNVPCAAEPMAHLLDGLRKAGLREG